MLTNLRKINKDQLLELAQNLIQHVKDFKSQIKKVIYSKVFEYYENEGIFETAENAGGSDSSTDYVMNYELEMQLKARELEIQMQRAGSELSRPQVVNTCVDIRVGMRLF